MSGCAKNKPKSCENAPRDDGITLAQERESQEVIWNGHQELFDLLFDPP